MKAVRAKGKLCASHLRPKAQLRQHARYVYKLRRELEPVQWILVNESQLAPSFLLRRVGLEAARLSAFHRRGMITRRELNVAMQQFSRRRTGIPVDGA